MQQIVEMTLPSGDPVWVRLAPAELAEPARAAQDVGLADTAAALVQAGQVAGFTETVHGIVASVRQALEVCRPDAFTVEFGVELSARSGKALSVLAEAGGTAHIKVTASWAGEGARVSTGEGGAG